MTTLSDVGKAIRQPRHVTFFHATQEMKSKCAETVLGGRSVSAAARSVL